MSAAGKLLVAALGSALVFSSLAAALTEVPRLTGPTPPMGTTRDASTRPADDG